MACHMSANFVMIPSTAGASVHKADHGVWPRRRVGLRASTSRNRRVIDAPFVIRAGAGGVGEIDDLPADWEGAGILGRGTLSRQGEGERGEKGSNKHNSNLPDFFKLLL